MLSNMKIGVRLAIGFAIVLLGLIIVSFVGLSGLEAVDSKVQTLVHDKFPKTVWANDITENINVNARAIRNILLTEDTSIRQKELDRLAETQKIIDNRLDSLRQTVKSDAGKELLSKVEKAQANYLEVREKFLGYESVGDKITAAAMLFKEMRVVQNAFFNSVSSLIKHQNNSVYEIGNAAIIEHDSLATIILSLGVIIFLLVLGFAFVITKSIVTPVKNVKEKLAELEATLITNLEDGLKSLSKGELSYKVDKSAALLNVDSRDEIGEMARSFDSMLTKTQNGVDAYEVVRTRITLLSNELNKLIEDAKNGLLDNRGDAQKFEGAYKDLIAGFNQVLDSVIIPVQEGTKVLGMMAAGDFTPRITSEHKGQHRLIKDSVNQLGESVGRIITDVTDAVQATASASNQISSSTEELAAGSQEQSAQSSEIASAVNQMSATIIETTRHAGEASQTAKDAGVIANEGGKAVEDTINGMGRIAIVVTRAAEVVKELGKGSEQIGEIAQVIDDIADQTNLLALNAAIEAARAGEQGRGFAVVADEVRKLAERTTKATKEIAAMIKRIQNDTKEAVVSMTEGTKEVEVGKELAEKAGNSLRQIIGATDRVVDIITQVAAASEEQSSAAEQISKNIEAISNVTHESASGTQQIARAAEDLNRLTDNLQNLVSQFKIDSYSNGGMRESKRLTQNKALAFN